MKMTCDRDIWCERSLSPSRNPARVSAINAHVQETFKNWGSGGGPDPLYPVVLMMRRCVRQATSSVSAGVYRPVGWSVAPHQLSYLTPFPTKRAITEYQDLGVRIQAPGTLAPVHLPLFDRCVQSHELLPSFALEQAASPSGYRHLWQTSNPISSMMRREIS